MGTFETLAAELLQRLAWTSLQAALLIAAVALLLRALPRLPAAARCALWWLVGLQVLLGLAWQAPIRLPLLAAPTAAAQRVAATDGGQPMPSPVAVASHDAGIGTRGSLPPTTANASATHTPGWWASHWRDALAAAWLLGLLAQLPALRRQYRHARALRRGAHPATDAALQTSCARQARHLGLRHVPAVLVSPAIASPQVSGSWRPVVLWPAHGTLDAETATLALAHELAHLKRGDLLLGGVPALATRLLFFHPPLRWAMREYALNREAACDAQAIAQQRAAPQDYGRLLLQLGVARPPHAGLAGASPTFHNLKRRLVMLQETSRAMPRRYGWLAVALIALVGVLPYRVVAGDQAAPATTAASARAADTWLPTPPPPPAPPAPPPPAPPVPPAAAMPAAPAAPPAPPPPPPPPPVAAPSGFAAHHMIISTHDDNGRGFALIDGDAISVNGTDSDLAVVQRLRRQGEPLLWFRRGKQAWVIRDRSYVQRAEAIYAPITALGQEQGKLGGQQGALGARQGELGRRQGELATRQGELAARTATLAVRQAQLASRLATQGSAASDSERQALQTETAKLDAARQALRDQQTALGQQQAALGQQQATFGQQQAALGKQQAAYGERQRAASAKADKQIDQLFDEALAKGVAKPVGES